MQATGRASVQSIDRAVSILDAFTAERPVLGVSDLARVTRLSRSTTHRLLSTLLAHDLVQQVPGSAGYALGARLLALAEVARAKVDLRSLATPVMTALRDRTGETVGLHVVGADWSRVTIAQVESGHALRRTYTDLGTPRPIHQGAPGKLLLAFAPGEAAEELLTRPLAAATPRTIVAPDALRRELAAIRRRGYATSLDERVEGVTGLAAPVRDHTGGVLAALSVSAPSVRSTPERLLAHAALAREAADGLSAALGHALGQAVAHAAGHAADADRKDLAR